MKSFRELIVWQKSMNLAIEVYKITAKFPKEELYGLTQQMRKSILSVPSNLAEGFGRQSPKEFARFVFIARGSLYEFQTQMELSIQMGYFSHDQIKELNNLTVKIEKMLNSLINKLIKK